jgi:LPXTG-motif cell wall-anchored protein
MVDLAHPIGDTGTLAKAYVEGPMRRTLMRRISVLLFLGLTSVVTVVLGATAAVGQQYPPTPQAPAAPVTPAAPPPGRALPSTGGDTMPLVWIALAALVAGTLLVIAARRRMHADRRHRLAD